MLPRCRYHRASANQGLKNKSLLETELDWQIWNLRKWLLRKFIIENLPSSFIWIFAPFFFPITCPSSATEYPEPFQAWHLVCLLFCRCDFYFSKTDLWNFKQSLTKIVSRIFEFLEFWFFSYFIKIMHPLDAIRLFSWYFWGIYFLELIFVNGCTYWNISLTWNGQYHMPIWDDPIEKIVEEIIAFNFSSPSPSSGSKHPPLRV